jgi:hypothetical protein
MSTKKIYTLKPTLPRLEMEKGRNSVMGDKIDAWITGESVREIVRTARLAAATVVMELAYVGIEY